MNPLYGYYRQYGDRGWVESMQRVYTSRYSGGAPGPAIVSPLDQYARSGKKLKKVAPDERTYYQQTAQTYLNAHPEARRETVVLGCQGGGRVKIKIRPGANGSRSENYSWSGR